ncbi:hypothetical protein THAOC_14154, partial [Thalassiosira oceanica]
SLSSLKNLVAPFPACGDLQTHVPSHPCQKRGSPDLRSACYSGAKKAFQSCVPICTGARLSVTAIEACKTIAKRSNNAASWCQKGYNFIQQQVQLSLDGYFAETESEEDGDMMIDSAHQSSARGKTEGHTKGNNKDNEKSDLHVAGKTDVMSEESIHKALTINTAVVDGKPSAANHHDTHLAVGIQANSSQETVILEGDKKEEKDGIHPVKKGAAATYVTTTGKASALPFGSKSTPASKSSLRPANSMTDKTVTQTIQEEEPQAEGSKPASESVVVEETVPNDHAELEESEPEF